ncbi:MAG: outer membrane beta-barrel protein [Candidatus Latescibacteria bacterium]|nr:outer membrane beta-barrel protein [Candidatus Latescibacterota bacterium]NIO77635.1 outer membrane beta-barrel protein [Candidatus Latescibacterota bacterium]
MASSVAAINGRVGLYVIRMEPEGTDAEKFSKPSWGGGINVHLVPPGLRDFFAGTIGFDYINMLSQTTEFIDRVTGLRVEQQTNQNYYRFYLGGRLGHQGHGFFRPYAGLHLALVTYSIKTDVVIPDDYDREKEIRQKLQSEWHSAFGFDMALGLELNFKDKVYADLGARYLRSFSLPQQLGEGSVEIHPRYFQFSVGIGLSFRVFERGGY